MRNFKLLTVCLIVAGTFIGCEAPKKADFTTSHKIEAPLLFNKEFQFLGGGDGAEVLIDTTKSEFDSLFTIVGAGDDFGLIVLSKEEEFDFGDLNEAIPEISADPANFSSEVGELEIGNFSSGDGNLGTASFQDLTGLNPAVVPAGTPIPGGSTPTPVNINVGSNTDFFVSATIKRGAIEISVTNNLGFDISAIDIDLNSGASVVGNTTINNVNNGQTTSDQIVFSDGDVLSNLNVDVSVSWNAQNTAATPGDLVVENIVGIDLVASQVEAALEAQDFSTSSSSTFDSSEFTFTDPSHYVELESGTISIDPIVNGLDLTIETLIISFPDIRQGPNYLASDSLVISYVNSGGVDGRILRSSTSVEKVVDLAGYRIFALGNEVNYNISAVTENTQDAAPGDQTRVINETQEISSSVSISNLAIKTAFGAIASQTTLLGDDDPSNGVDVIDLFNETETELTEIDGLEDLSGQIDGLEFTQTALTINYTSNIGVPTTIYAAMLGIDGEGEQIFLSGTAAETQVEAGDPISGILNNGVQVTPEQMIKFTLTPSPDGSTIVSSTVFDETNSTVSDFLNNLPSEIRFVGKSIVNESNGEATISTPLEFDPSISIDLPLAFRTETAATFSDTTETSDFEDFPKGEDDTQIADGELIISYENGLPLGFDIELIFVDSLDAEVTSVPLPGDDLLELLASEVDATTRFSSNPSTGNLVIALTTDQLNQLYRTRKVILSANLRTTNNEEVKMRAEDSIIISVSAKLKIETTVN
ncbi:MAG: hypothetical protein RLN81_15785 [Balneolaceae bacterium]